MQHNLLCVKHGSYYGPEYVINLYNGTRKHSSIDFNFHVLTDDDSLLPKDKGWIIHKLPDWRLDQNKAWFYKMVMFDKALAIRGRNLYIDLDCVIIDDIDDIWKYSSPDFVICQDFNRVYNPDFRGINSSVMSWTDDDLAFLYESFSRDVDSFTSKYRGDQDVIQDLATKRSLYPKEWMRSYRWEIWRGGIKDNRINNYFTEKDICVIPEGCKIAVFHGKPKPHEITDSQLRQSWSG